MNRANSPLPTILVVDDQPNNLQVAGSTLSESGKYNIHLALNGEKALEHIERYPPDLILLDVMMPGLSGYDVCRKLKQDPRYRSIPIIFLTALNSTENMVEGFNVGGADYVTKPFDASILLARVETHLKLYHLLKREVENKHELEREVAKRTQELVVANQAKDEFLATMSHELRTPLTTMIGNSEILAESRLSEDQRDLLASMDISSKNLLSLINDILDLSRIETGKFEVDYAPFDLHTLLDEVEQMFTVSVRDAGLSFEINQQIEPEYQLWGDGKRIGQILINLLGNAVKFTEQGGVILACWVDDSDTLNFAVEDTGIGIPAEVQKRIFNPFEQADGRISRRYGGTGLGLHISSSLAEVMEGTIEVSSEEGKGSRFVLKLPFRESELLVQSPNPAKESDASPSVLSSQFVGDVLIVEDTPELQLLETRIVESMGATATVANNGKEAVDLATAQHFDLVLMDMQMPVMDGIEATETLRSRGNPVPIVALTANVMQKHKNLFHEAGANGFLQKPIDKGDLQNTLRRYLKLDHEFPLGEQNPDPEEAKEVNVQLSASGAHFMNEPLYDQPPYPILVIDDEASVLEFYQLVLEGEDRDDQGITDDLMSIMEEGQPDRAEQEFTLTLASQGLTGIELAQQALDQDTPFPIAFIDMRMPPGIDGLETAKALRKLDKRIYIVIVTAYSTVDPKEIERILEYGVLYLKKPFAEREIRLIARMLSKFWTKERELEQKSLHVEQGERVHSVKTEVAEWPPLTEEQEVAYTHHTAPAAAEEEVDEELMAIFFESGSKNREKLTAALLKKDWAEVRAVAHTIKGSAASFGYPELSKMAESVQFSIDEEKIDQAPAFTMDLVIEMGKVLP